MSAAANDRRKLYKTVLNVPIINEDGDPFPESESEGENESDGWSESESESEDDECTYVPLVCLFRSEWQREVYADDNYDAIVHLMDKAIAAKYGEGWLVEGGMPIEELRDAGDAEEVEVDATGCI
jgi:hypothetical protein